MATLESLEQRVATLEQEVAEFRAGSRQVPTEESRGARLIHEAQESHAAVVAEWKKLLANLGIQGQPMGAKKFREMLIAQGFNPDDNAFSREILAMREE